MFTLQLHNYKIYTGEVLTSMSEFLKARGYTRMAILTDENVLKFCTPLLPENILQNAAIIEIPSGEEFKTIKTCELVWKGMMDAKLDRSSVLLNLGGGVVGDLGGFCAATYFRGIDFVQVPTTLLSMADASIGGKLGVDFRFAKNSIGVFQNPCAVFMHMPFLETLPEAEILSGFAEIIKHGLIHDAALWADLQKLDTLHIDSLDALLYRSLLVKKAIVELDPSEQHIRKALNYGHTIGHAIESFMLQTNRPLKHGEAVALGLICESWIAMKVKGLPEADFKAISEYLKGFYQVLSFDSNDYREILELMRKDKKNRDGKINFTLINPIAKAHIDNYVEEGLILESLEILASL